MDSTELIQLRYRLQPHELPDGQHRVTVEKVSLQGVERLFVVLHLREYVKPLVLDREQTERIVRYFKSSVFEEWQGRRLVLFVSHQEGTIALFPEVSPRPSFLHQLSGFGQREGLSFASPILALREWWADLALEETTRMWISAGVLLGLLALIGLLVVLVERVP